MYEKERYLLLKGLPKELKEELYKNKAMIIGGAIRSIFTKEKINDYDIYFKEIKGLNTMYSYISGASGASSQEVLNKDKKPKPLFGLKKFTKTSNAYSFYNKKTGLKIQLIRTFSGNDVNYIFGKFDFTVCMGAYDFEKNIFIFGDRFFKDNTSKTLIINLGTEYPINTMLRVKKYLRKGYSISGIEMVKLALTINNVSIITHEELQHHLMGIDTLILEKFFDEKGKKVGEGEDQNLGNLPYDYSTFIDELQAFIEREYSHLRFGDDDIL
ncbi:MAG: hypothetical protein ACFFDY_00080 [Candidatus Thorarchaeota archaeon]